KIAMEFHGQLPAGEAPEHTEGYEGFYHLSSIKGDVEETRMQYLIRDFDRQQFEGRKARMESIAAELRAKYGHDKLVLDIRDQYYNMREKIEPNMDTVNVAADVMRHLGIEPVMTPIRGGTDGSQLSYMGLPTPNLFTGGENYHGRFEYISVDNMVKATEIIIGIIRRFEERAQS